MVIITHPRVYSTVNVGNDSALNGCDSYQIRLGNGYKYVLGNEIGTGAYGHVFEGLNTVTNERVVIKRLKRTRLSRAKREIEILEYLRGGVNVLTLLDVIKTSRPTSIAIICDFLSKTTLRDSYIHMNYEDVRHCTLALLKALDFCHSRGILHRDVKPSNIVVDRESRRIQLIDFGLAEYYLPGKPYSVNVGTRYYKAPELLVGYEYYDYAVDIWAVGCLVASMLLRVNHFFKGKDDVDQLNCIASVLGTNELCEYVRRYEIEMSSQLQASLISYERRPWTVFAQRSCVDALDQADVDFLNRTLCYDHQERMTAGEAMRHAFLSSLFESEQANVGRSGMASAEQRYDKSAKPNRGNDCSVATSQVGSSTFEDLFTSEEESRS